MKEQQLDCCERQVLAEAALGGHVGAAQLLLAAGASPDRWSETQGTTPHSCATATGGATAALFAADAARCQLLAVLIQLDHPCVCV